jgi:hypothetical protein
MAPFSFKRNSGYHNSRKTEIRGVSPMGPPWCEKIPWFLLEMTKIDTFGKRE